MPRKVLRESYDIPLETDEQNQQESDYDNDLDEDDGHYNMNAIPPAPKLQGKTVPRTGDANTTQITATKNANSNENNNSIENQRTFAEGNIFTTK